MEEEDESEDPILIQHVGRALNGAERENGDISTKVSAVGKIANIVM